MWRFLFVWGRRIQKPIKRTEVMNAGEINEFLVKLTLIYLRDKGIDCIVDGKKIKIDTVGMFHVQYRSLPQTIKTIENLRTLSPLEIEDVASYCGVSKAGAYTKTDVMINGEGYSIKSLQTAPPALVNHTARDGWENVCKRIGTTIENLDEIIEEYWFLRQKGIIGEDVLNSDTRSPFRKHKDYLKPILNYFLFKGSATRDSSAPASYILDIFDPCDVSTWRIYGDDFLDRKSHWEKLVFSLRAKKGMGNYPNIRDISKKKSMDKWTVFFQNEYRGALHVRLKK